MATSGFILNLLAAEAASKDVLAQIYLYLYIYILYDNLADTSSISLSVNI